MRPLPAALLLALTLAATHAPLVRGQPQPWIPDPVGFVNDHAGVMDETARARLEAFLDQVKRKTGAEFAVLTVKTTAPLDPADYKVKVFEQWKLGARGESNGLLLLVAMDERKIWFETGYGLEGTLPDGLQSRIIREEMTPRFRAGDVSGGITAGVLRASARIAAEKGVTLEWNGSELRYGERASGRGLPPAVIAILVFFVLLGLIRRLFGGWTGPGYGGGWRGGGAMGPIGWGGGFGGGSFGGGGGSFGGFGGGSSGGGGGGGGW